MRPLDPRLIREARATIWFIAAVVALALLATAATVTIAFSLSSFIVGIFVEGRDFAEVGHFLAIALAAATLRALVHFVQEWAGFHASAEVKQRLRSRALDVISSRTSEVGKSHGTGTLSMLLGPGLESLDVYFAKYLPQLVFTALVTPFFVALVWFLDPTSATALIFTLPLIPIFMILIGLVTKDVQQKQLHALEQLNGHFYEILRGIQTLKIFDRTERQVETLRSVALEHRNRTMKVLRVSFLSGFALELAASLSVALIAVTIGLRLVDGQLDLFTGLFVLLIAPEAYLPLRNVGAQFHASAEGVEVSGRVLDVLETPGTEAAKTLEFETGITALTGPSGAGKSTALRSMLGSGVSWMPQHSSLLAGSVEQNIAGFYSVQPELLRRAVELAALDDVPLDTILESDTRLSGGQLQRVAFARTAYHALKSASKLLLLDEPASQQDPQRQRKIAESIQALAAEGIDVVMATHQAQLLKIANREVKLEGGS